jgi:DNA-binding Lrp family transcriptional regulator
MRMDKLDRAILKALADGKPMKFEPLHKAIQACGHSADEATVRRRLRDLIDRGLIRREHEGGDEGDSTSHGDT